MIGRDHLDCGSVASPNRETESMKDGSDAVADWPILNALINTACGASWVSHHGGGVGMGYSLHAGQVIVADGTDSAARRLERVLDADPAIEFCATLMPDTRTRSKMPKNSGSRFLESPFKTEVKAEAKKKHFCSTLTSTFQIFVLWIVP